MVDERRAINTPLGVLEKPNIYPLVPDDFLEIFLFAAAGLHRQRHGVVNLRTPLSVFEIDRVTVYLFGQPIVPELLTEQR